MEVVRETLSLQEKIARLKLFGPQTKEDIFLLYSLINGDVEIPDSVVFSLDEGKTKAGHFNRGFLNVKRWAQEGKPAANPLGKTWGAGLFGEGKGQPTAGNAGLGFAAAFPGQSRVGKGRPLFGKMDLLKSLGIFGNGLQ